MQTDIEQSSTDLVTIAVAQRYSVLVQARNDTSANWAIHANMDTSMFDKVPPNLQISMQKSLFASLRLLLRHTICRYHIFYYIQLVGSDNKSWIYQPIP